MSDVFWPLVSAFVVAVMNLLGSWWLFRHRFVAEERAKVVRQQLEELLLPLFFRLKREEWGLNALLATESAYLPEEWIADAPERLKKLRSILEKRMYLAEGETHKRCLDFLEWLDRNYDTRERFQRVMRELYEGAGDRGDHALHRFTKAIETAYERKRQEYLGRRANI